MIWKREDDAHEGGGTKTKAAARSAEAALSAATTSGASRTTWSTGTSCGTKRFIHVMRDEVELVLWVQIDAVVAGTHPVAVAVHQANVKSQEP